MSAQQLKLQADKIERQVADMRFRQKLLGVSELLVKYFFNAGIIENVAIFEFSAVELLKIDGVSKVLISFFISTRMLLMQFSGGYQEIEASHQEAARTYNCFIIHRRL